MKKNQVWWILINENNKIPGIQGFNVMASAIFVNKKDAIQFKKNIFPIESRSGFKITPVTIKKIN